MLKPCRRCRQLIPAQDWEAHQNAHKNAENPRQTGWGSEWAKIRKQALERDGYRCQRCGRSRAELGVRGITLHVHHINGQSSDNRLANLQVLCDPCHARGGSRRILP